MITIPAADAAWTEYSRLTSSLVLNIESGVIPRQVEVSKNIFDNKLMPRIEQMEQNSAVIK